MAYGLSAPVADDVLALILNGTAFSGFSEVYVLLHVGDPGASGTANVAGENTLEAAGSFNAPSGGSTTNAAAINWTDVSTAETYTNVSLWSSSDTATGTFIASGTITASAVAVGDNFQIPAGDMTVSMITAS